MLYPKRFLMWCWAKTVIQLTISILSLSFIVQSGFFVPTTYDATVWSPGAIATLYLPQGLFEVFDLITELWMLKKQKAREHLPWDSIIHHVVSGLYAFYIVAYAEELDRGFLGLAVAALSCQLIGPLYTLHRWKWRHRHLSLAILTVQLLYRTPLAVVSVVRAIQHYNVAPLPHLIIILCLSYLDYKWIFWAVAHNRKMQREHRAARRQITKSVAMSGTKTEAAAAGVTSPGLQSLHSHSL